MIAGLINQSNLKRGKREWDKKNLHRKQSVKSKDLINRSRNRFVAAKIDDNVTLYAMCSQKEYERTIVNKSIGLFFTLGDDTIRVIVQ